MLEDSSQEHSNLSRKIPGILGQSPVHIRAPRQINLTNSLNEILAFARKEEATDIHLCALNPLIIRKLGNLTVASSDIFTHQHINALIMEALPAEIVKTFKKTGDIEYVHTVPGYGRFRIVLNRHRFGFEVIVRLITLEIPNFAASGMPTSCANLIKWAQGIILITGPAGAGKTTTLATFIDMINQRRHEHIVIIEDPIEIIHEPNLSHITQRQVGAHTLSQRNALRAALREDPDIIVVGEIKNFETLHIAITAAETGHLVFGTLNTINATQTISRLIDSFPTEEQQIVRNLISESLRGIICQQLIPKKDGSGMVAAYEVLLNNSSIANHIRKGTVNQIENSIITNKSAGMVLMNHSLKALLDNDVISQEEYQSHLNQESVF